MGLTVLENTNTTEQYSIEVQSEISGYTETGTVTIINNSNRTIDSWTIEMLNGQFFDPKSDAGENDVIISNSLSHKIKELFGEDLPDVHNTIVSGEDVEIPPNSEYSFSYYNPYSVRALTVDDIELTISYKMDVLFFFTMMAALFIAAVAMIIPGVSGSFVMMLLGVYTTVIAAIKDFDLLIIIPCVVGAILGIILGARLISTLIKKHGLMMYSGIMGLVIGSVYAILPAGFGFNLSTGYGFVALICGILTSVIIDKVGKPKSE